MEEIITFVVNLGIAGGIAIYLVKWITESLNNTLMELKQSINELKKSIDELKMSVIRMNTKINMYDGDKRGQRKNTITDTSDNNNNSYYADR